MIRKIRHKGLKRLCAKGDRRGLPPEHVEFWRCSIRRRTPAS